MAQAQDLINSVFQLLSQAGDSPLAGLSSGFDESYLIDPTTAMLTLLTQAQNDLARSCMPIPDTATVIVANGSKSTGPYQLIFSPAGRQLYRPQGMMNGTFTLKAARYGDFQSWYNRYDPATGRPKAFADLNVSALLALPAKADTLFTFDPAFFLPLPLATADTAVDPFIDEEYQQMIGYRVAWLIASRNLDNPDVATRATTWMGLYNQFVTDKYELMISNDPTLGAIFPPVGQRLQALPNTPPKKQVVL